MHNAISWCISRLARNIVAQRYFSSKFNRLTEHLKSSAHISYLAYPTLFGPVQTGQTDQFHRAKLFLVETSLNASIDFIDESTFWSWPSGKQNISAYIFYALRMHCMALDALNLLLLGKKRERVPFTQVARKYVAKNILIMQLLYFSANYAKKF